MDIEKIHAGVTNVTQGAWVKDLPFADVGDLALRVRGGGGAAFTAGLCQAGGGLNLRTGMPIASSAETY